MFSTIINFLLESFIYNLGNIAHLVGIVFIELVHKLLILCTPNFKLHSFVYKMLTLNSSNNSDRILSKPPDCTLHSRCCGVFQRVYECRK